MSTAEKYVTAAYYVVLAFVVAYVVIIALKLQRLEREVDALAGHVEQEPEAVSREPAVVG
ncbi:MAG TPA: hypothetical protein VJ986_02660 [Gaiellaceae bacterium]|nr:hypothetical protein [Gaiellaceae bacterium]